MTFCINLLYIRGCPELAFLNRPLLGAFSLFVQPIIMIWDIEIRAWDQVVLAFLPRSLVGWVGFVYMYVPQGVPNPADPNWKHTPRQAFLPPKRCFFLLSVIIKPQTPRDTIFVGRLSLFKLRNIKLHGSGVATP